MFSQGDMFYMYMYILLVFGIANLRVIERQFPSGSLSMITSRLKHGQDFSKIDSIFGFS